ncbi:MAG TPA: cation diffusion facilitator family transporter [Spirochaetota bacterium]|nr:cation diffusion facilitator family transporter [Spirochaetota bacterium]
MSLDHSAVHEKKRVALFSVLAAVFLTGSKLLIGLLTGSLGILSEALHSCLDLVAAIITYFSVRISDKPADSDHHFGHGKVENLSALMETFLLLITSVWIIHEAAHRLMTGNVKIEVTVWSYIVVISSIAVDFSRSRALMKAAKIHNSQALEADAIHFSTDIWSSSVVLLGLVCSNFGFYYADPVAALFVALIVIYVCFILGKKAVDVLLDGAPADYVEVVEKIAENVRGLTSVHDIKARMAGADVFLEVCVHLNPSSTLEEAHRISHEFEKLIHEKISRCRVHIHQEPEECIPDPEKTEGLL